MVQAAGDEGMFNPAFGPWSGSGASGASQKDSGAYYTPSSVVSTLLRWAVHDESDRLLDPSCGDGRFIAGHPNSLGIDHDPSAVRIALGRAPNAVVHQGDFFRWAENTHDRFECAAGNPPFIRYQTFSKTVRAQALNVCARLGARFSGLTSSWAPFLVVAASLLKPGGRMAFVVPAEIGHAPYASPLLEYLVGSFDLVHIVAVREKLFPELSEDCWLLYAEGFGGATAEIRLTALHHFSTTVRPPRRYDRISVRDWRVWNRRLRPFLISSEARESYRAIADHAGTKRFGDIASIGIGYVSGANDFFHLRLSDAQKWGIERKHLHPSARNGRVLPPQRLTRATVEKWERANEPIFLLRLPKTSALPSSVVRYLETDDARSAREAYKCRTRDPWYSVPDVQVPHFFLTYMSGLTPALVRNEAGCTCTNSLHSVRLHKAETALTLAAIWNSDFTQLSCELEGHSLGGGLLKLEPREASQIVLASPAQVAHVKARVVEEAILSMRGWRHYGGRA